MFRSYVVGVVVFKSYAVVFEQNEAIMNSRCWK